MALDDNFGQIDSLDPVRIVEILVVDDLLRIDVSVVSDDALRPVDCLRLSDFGGEIGIRGVVLNNPILFKCFFAHSRIAERGP